MKKNILIAVIALLCSVSSYGYTTLATGYTNATSHNCGQYYTFSNSSTFYIGESYRYAFVSVTQNETFNMSGAVYQNESLVWSTTTPTSAELCIAGNITISASGSCYYNYRSVACVQTVLW